MALFALVFAALSQGTLAAEAANADAAPGNAARPPNIILILADDLGWRDTGFTGSRYYETPYIDSIARAGVNFSQAYSAANLCSPSRAALLTGRYPARLGLTFLTRDGARRPLELPPDPYFDVGRPLMSVRYPDHLERSEVTLAQYLHEAGYVSALVGKWHLGGEGHGANDFGFDYNYGGTAIGRPPSYFDPYTSEYLPGRIGFAPREEGEYLLDREAEEATAFVRAHQGEPFFLYWSTYSVHEPVQAKPERIRYFAEKAAPDEQNNPVYAAMLSHLDDAVGRLLATLDEAGLSDNTVVILTSDNGGYTEVTSNAPLKGTKQGPYEGGMRVPLFVRWPGVAAPGSTVDTPVHGVDLFSTILDIADIEEIPGTAIDGMSLLPALNGSAEIEREALYWHFPHYGLAPHPRDDSPPHAIIREGKWKLIHYFEGDTELYDLVADPGETRDLASSEPARVLEMQAKLDNWLMETNAAIPVSNPNFSEWALYWEEWGASLNENYVNFRILMSRIKRFFAGAPEAA